MSRWSVGGLPVWLAVGLVVLAADVAGRLRCGRYCFGSGQAEFFVQRQVGHRYQSTTAIYSGVSGDFMNTMMRKALDRAFATDEEHAR